MPRKYSPDGREDYWPAVARLTLFCVPAWGVMFGAWLFWPTASPPGAYSTQSTTLDVVTTTRADGETWTNMPTAVTPYPGLLPFETASHEPMQGMVPSGAALADLLFGPDVGQPFECRLLVRVKIRGAPGSQLCIGPTPFDGPATCVDLDNAGTHLSDWNQRTMLEVYGRHGDSVADPMFGDGTPRVLCRRVERGS